MLLVLLHKYTNKTRKLNVKLQEIFNYEAEQRSITNMKQNAKLLMDRAKQAQARLNAKKAQQKLIQAQKPLITVQP